MSDLKAITLWQPHASLVAERIKRVETRGWTTKYRGPLAIHAAARKPPRVWSQDGPPAVYDQIAIERYLEIREDGNQPGQYAYDWHGPLGAVVATCTLVDVVPIIADGSPEHRDIGFQSYVLASTGRLLRLCDWANTGWGEGIESYGARHVGIETQRPYGDFTPGRFAWLLADIKSLDRPVPARGRQGLWNPDADLVEALAA